MMEEDQLVDTINDAIRFALANLHTATIAKVQTVNANTIDVQPVINRVVDGVSIKLPVFSKVPPLFMQGGGSSTTYPIAVGDYVLLILTERCFDRWYSGSDFQNPSEFRMHDYSDGIAICGINPLASALVIPAVITHTGDIEHTGDSNHTGDTVHTGDLNQTGDIDVTGNITASAAGTFLSVSTGTITATGTGTFLSVSTGAIAATSMSMGGSAGASGSFTTVDGKTVTVTGGLITAIV